MVVVTNGRDTHPHGSGECGTQGVTGILIVGVRHGGTRMFLLILLLLLLHGLSEGHDGRIGRGQGTGQQPTRVLHRCRLGSRQEHRGVGLTVTHGLDTSILLLGPTHSVHQGWVLLPITGGTTTTTFWVVTPQFGPTGDGPGLPTFPPGRPTSGHPVNPAQTGIVVVVVVVTVVVIVQMNGLLLMENRIGKGRGGIGCHHEQGSRSDIVPGRELAGSRLLVLRLALRIDAVGPLRAHGQGGTWLDLDDRVYRVAR